MSDPVIPPVPFDASQLDVSMLEEPLASIVEAAVLQFSRQDEFNHVVAKDSGAKAETLDTLTAPPPASLVGPTGPQQVVVDTVGTTFHLTWAKDESGADVTSYTIWREPRGTRLAPTSSNFSLNAVYVDSVSPGQISCLPVGSRYTWLDRNLTIPNLDPANPVRFGYFVQSVDSQGRLSLAVEASGSPIEAVTNAPGDNSPESESKVAPLNKLVNAQFASRTIAANTNVYDETLVTAATNAAPIQITTGTNHGFVTGDQVYVGGVNGNTAANGVWIITFVGATQFTLNGSTGNGAWTNGGHCIDATGYPTFPTGNTFSTVPAVPPETITCFFTPWYQIATASAFGSNVIQWVSDGTTYTGEVVLKGPAAGNQVALQQDIGYPRLANSAHMTFSVYAKVSVVPTNSTLELWCTAGNNLFKGVFSGTTLTTAYQRYVFNFVATASVAPSFYNGYVWIINKNTSGTGRDITIARPMLSIGDNAGPWNPVLDTDTTLGSGITITTATWSRTVGQIIKRDSSAPYS